MNKMKKIEKILIALYNIEEPVKIFSNRQHPIFKQALIMYKNISLDNLIMRYRLVESLMPKNKKEPISEYEFKINPLFKII